VPLPTCESIDEGASDGAGAVVLGVVVVLPPYRRIVRSARREPVKDAPVAGRTLIVSDEGVEHLIRSGQVTRSEYPGRVNCDAA
jgi:hypothetical protein